MLPLPSFVRTCMCAAVAEDTRSTAAREPAVSPRVCASAVRRRAAPRDLVRARRQVALPRRGADVEPVDDDPQRLASRARARRRAPAWRLRRERRVDDRLAVGGDLGPGRRTAAKPALVTLHVVRPAATRTSAGTGEVPSGLPSTSTCGPRLVDADREPAGLGRELLQALRDEGLVGGRELGADGRLRLVVRVVRLAEATELVERVGDAHLRARAGRGLVGAW